jgi:hypothetical protein
MTLEMVQSSGLRISRAQDTSDAALHAVHGGRRLNVRAQRRKVIVIGGAFRLGVARLAQQDQFQVDFVLQSPWVVRALTS